MGILTYEILWSIDGLDHSNMMDSLNFFNLNRKILNLLKFKTKTMNMTKAAFEKLDKIS